MRSVESSEEDQLGIKLNLEVSPRGAALFKSRLSRIKGLSWSTVGQFIRGMARNRVAYYFILPTIMAMLVIHFLPMLGGILMSFHELNMRTLREFLSSPYIGLNNYKDILFNPASTIRIGFSQAVRNTAIYTLVVTFGALLVGLYAAILLNRSFLGRGLIRTLFLLPWVVPTYVVGLLWGFLWRQDMGLINEILVRLQYLVGIENVVRPFWLIGTNVIWAIIIPTIWRNWPMNMIFLLAGLQTIPDELYEAAAIDGANFWQRFRHVTLPMLKPVFAVIILMGLIFNTYSYNIVAMMFGHGAGFPGEWGDILMTNITRNTFGLWEFGKGAAASTLLMLSMVLIVLLWQRIFKEALTRL